MIKYESWFNFIFIRVLSRNKNVRYFFNFSSKFVFFGRKIMTYIYWGKLRSFFTESFLCVIQECKTSDYSRVRISQHDSKARARGSNYLSLLNDAQNNAFQSTVWEYISWCALSNIVVLHTVEYSCAYALQR